MERGDVKEVVEHLDKADEVIRHRLHHRQPLGEQHALGEARELLQKAITELLPYQESP